MKRTAIRFAALATGGAAMLAACGSDLPSGLASRITATGDVFSLAVPDGWADMTTANGSPLAGSHGSVADHQLVVGPAPAAKDRVVVLWGSGPFGINSAGVPVPLTIAGESVTGITDAAGLGLSAGVRHTVDGRTVDFQALCSPDLPRNTCVSILQSWQWDSVGGSGRLLLALAGAVAAAALAGGASVLLIRRRRRVRAPA